MAADQDQDQDILLGRLAVHYKFLAKDKAADAIRLWRSAGGDQDLGAFLVTESYIPPDALPKLLQARDKYLAKQQAKEPAPAAPAPEAPAPAAPAAVVPPPEAGPPAGLVGAATVRLTPEMVAAAQAPTPPTEVEPPPQPTGVLSFDSVPMEGPLGAEGPSADATLVQAQEPPGLGAPPPAVTPIGLEPEPETAPVPELLATPAPSPPAPPPAETPAPAPVVTQPGSGLLGHGPGVTLADLLTRCAELGVSDLHVHSGAPLKARVHGELTDASDLISHEEAERLIFGQLSGEQRSLLEEHMQLDFSFPLEGVGRFRSNVYLQHRGLDGVFRVIPPEPPTLESLGLPESLGRYSEYHQGIVLLTGPGGCGKSSTMAALVSMINHARKDHILTIEDPIEYVHRPAGCVVNQREVGPHTGSFARALRAALREDPDIIVIGELRDLETISLALTAAETGHLVMATLHTASTIPTLNRLVGVFPPDQQAQIRTMVSESLRVIISQRLVSRADGQGRVPALEILVNNKAVGNLVRENRTFQIKSILQTGAREGMCMLDSSLAQLVKDGVITKEAARLEALEPKQFA